MSEADYSIPPMLSALKIQCSERPRNNVIGWNQADQYLLNQLHQQFGHDLTSQRLAVINDNFGAITLALQHGFSLSVAPVCYSDSAISRRWYEVNAKMNKLSACTIYDVAKIADGAFDIALLRLPKNLHYFRYQLAQLASHRNVTVYVAGMQKHWPSSFYKAAEDFFSEVEVYPGVKKAKCMRLSQPKSSLSDLQALSDAVSTLDIEEYDLRCTNFPNVFSREKLDIGTRFLLDNFPDLSAVNQVIDLGCGNGLLGIYALKKFPHIKVSFYDESCFALESAKQSLLDNHLSLTAASFHHDDCLSRALNIQVDTILCNPPFHQLHTVSTDIASTMFKQSAERLVKGGSLFIVANKHLPYKPLLKNSFSAVNIIASNKKFIIYQAIKSST